MQLNPKKFGLALGIFGGVLWLFTMGFSLTTGIGTQTIIKLGSFHPGFSYSWGGLIWMIVLHFLAGTVFGWVFVKLYNALVK